MIACRVKDVEWIDSNETETVVMKILSRPSRDLILIVSVSSETKFQTSRSRLGVERKDLVYIPTCLILR